MKCELQSLCLVRKSLLRNDSSELKCAERDQTLCQISCDVPAAGKHSGKRTKSQTFSLCVKLDSDTKQAHKIVLGQGVFALVLCSRQMDIIGGQEDLFIEHSTSIVSWPCSCIEE